MKKIFTTTGKALAFFLGWAILTGLMPFPDSSNGAVWRFWAELIPLLSAAGFTLLFWLPERRKLTLPLCTAPLKSAIIGFAAGVLWLGIAAGVLLLTGTMHITGYQQVPLLGLWILSALLNTIMQELLIRGYLYQLIKAQYSTAAAAIATTALFTFLHGGALEAGIIPTLNVVTMSLLMGLVLEYTQCLLASLELHRGHPSGRRFSGGGLSPAVPDGIYRPRSPVRRRSQNGGQHRCIASEPAAHRRVCCPAEKTKAIKNHAERIFLPFCVFFFVQ